ncbi:CDP-alcohol phosphatidyltransferase family protein [Geoglobus ahangari]
MKKHIDVADYFSFFNVLFGFMAIVMRDPRYLFLAALMDGFDGYLARKGYSGRYGKYVDSLADFASFGVATAFFFPTFSLAYLLAGMYRLARFTAEHHENFVGFPITSASLLVISTRILAGDLIAGIVSVAIAFFMISDIEYRKLRNPVLLLIFAACLMGGLFRIEFVYAILLLSTLYLLSPPFSRKLGKYF